MHASLARGDWDKAVAVAGIANGDVDASVGLVFEAAEQVVLERSSEEEAVGRVFYDMRVDFEGNVADLHG
jgi:hypothetical protein